MKLPFLIYILPLALAAESPTTTSTIPNPIFTIPCIVGNYQGCPTGSICIQTMVCGGLCFPTPTPIPPPHKCVVGRGCCPSPSTCSATTTCAHSGHCGGICTTAPPPPTFAPCTVGAPSQCPPGATCTPDGASGVCITTQSPYTVPCVMGGNNCGSSSTCTPTEVCGGLCIPTAPPQVPCDVHFPNGICPSRSTCTPTVTCPPHGPCGGVCIATPSPISISAI